MKIGCKKHVTLAKKRGFKHQSSFTRNSEILLKLIYEAVDIHKFISGYSPYNKLIGVRVRYFFLLSDEKDLKKINIHGNVLAKHRVFIKEINGVNMREFFQKVVVLSDNNVLHNVIFNNLTGKYEKQ